AGSVRIAPLPALGPALLTTIVYDSAPPPATVVTPSVLVIERSALRIVSVSVDELLPVVGSVVPAGAAMLAILLIVPDAAAVPVTWTVTVLPLGSVGIVMPPALCRFATVTTPAAGQAAPPVTVPQVMPVTVRLATAGSVRIAPSPMLGPALLTTMV